ncbi:MAG TPA: menaquinone biosynthesis protein [Thermoanaerobaculia bacterium]|nr:menaquinone biosynthesis protein [Thermoanaerobaculia bacterium]
MRISVVDFLNARPLTWGLLTNAPAGVEVSRDMPSVCADKLRDGRADAGLIPSIEYRRIPDLVRVEGLGIAAESEVRSVLLVSKVSREKIRRLKLDPASRTSAALVRILLKRRYGIVPEIVPGDADAELVIGDPALKASQVGRVVVDLAAEWRTLTGFPFVFAFWAVRREAWSPALENVLRESHRASEAGFDAMVDAEVADARAAGNEALSRAMIEDYLRHCLHYGLTSADVAGLDRFYELAREDRVL